MSNSEMPPDRRGRRLVHFAREETLVFLIAGGAAVAYLVIAFVIGP